jgi:hypothetical protein
VFGAKCLRAAPIGAKGRQRAMLSAADPVHFRLRFADQFALPQFNPAKVVLTIPARVSRCAIVPPNQPLTEP